MSCTIGNPYKIKANDTLFKIADRELGDGDRCDVFSAIASAGNYDLHGPIEVHTPNHDAIIP